MPYAKNQGPDQPTHARSLIKVFIVGSLDGIICILAIFKVSRFELHIASVVAQTGLNITWSQVPVDKVSRDVAKM